MMSQTTHEVGTTVRFAAADDAGAIAELVNRAYRVEEFFVGGDRTTTEEIRAQQRRGDFLVLDRGDGSLAAGVYVELRGERGFFGPLAVAPDLQGSGLGRRLIAVAEAVCAARGCRLMELQVVNLRAELPPFYRSLGYRECGTSPFPADAPAKLPCHFIHMAKPLEG
jgi:GNAT superfamily N-acetyltransferase